MDRVRKIWEVELSVVLEVTRPGHRKRMLASLGNRPIEPELPPSLAPHDLSLELSKLVRSCSCMLVQSNLLYFLFSSPLVWCVYISSPCL